MVPISSQLDVNPQFSVLFRIGMPKYRTQKDIKVLMPFLFKKKVLPIFAVFKYFYFFEHVAAQKPQDLLMANSADPGQVWICTDCAYTSALI